MPESTYSIAMLAAEKYLCDTVAVSNMDMGGYRCDEGEAQIVARSGDTVHLVIATAKRRRGEVSEPRVGEAKMRRIAMSYVIEHPDVSKVQFDILEALIGEHATVSINANLGAYRWER